MGSMKGAGALIAALVPIAFCGAMIFYFFNIGGGSVSGVTALGLGPTMLGLGAIGLLFVVPLFARLIRLATTPPASGGRSRVTVEAAVEEEAFDADAALARYLARKAAGEEMQVEGPDKGEATPVLRPMFGRKVA